ncbi:ceramide-1-phosphate transfer protein-like [Nelusetta ayraudi]|uniref:ceramide-1-phosphate transfer protein-like n=1 Tax=Nelusetta ayraudi TaxID=303726 RepID=UPI003F6EB9FB
MVFLRRTARRRLLSLTIVLALLLVLSCSIWLPQSGESDCGGAGQPCLYKQEHEPPLAAKDQKDTDYPVPPMMKECPGQSFQAWRLLQHLESSLANTHDVLLEPYLQSWDQLLYFMESLGTIVNFFSKKVKEKVDLIRELSLRATAKDYEKDHLPSQSLGLKNDAYHSVRSMIKAELQAQMVDFSRRTNSGCRTLLRLHRSLLWLKLMLEGLAEEPGADGRFKTPGELSRDAYMVALAPHHTWMLRQAAELVFHALPDRQYFLQVVCVQSQKEATPILSIIIRALASVHTQTERIMAEYDMLELP